MRICLLILCVACMTAPARGDGKMFAPPGVAAVNIPDQQALIHYDPATQIETLVIETSFEGEGDAFAWVVPTPDVPQVREASAGLFPTLRAIFQPHVRMEGESWWLLVLFLWACCAALVMNRPWVAALLIVILLLVSLFSPALGGARRGLSGGGGDVTIHQRTLIGNYDTAIISSTDPAALLTWLNDEGFTVPPAAEPVIAQYVAEGWSFVAAKLHVPTDDAADDAPPARPHPLALTFTTAQPIYPMRLTGVNNSPVALDLYVFGPQRAAAPHMQVVRCSQTATPEPTDVYDSLRRSGPVRIRHENLRALVGDAPFATKLSGTLDAAAMQHDLPVTFNGQSTSGEVKYSTMAVWQHGMNVGMVVLAATTLVVLIAYRAKKVTEPQSVQAVLACVVLSVVVGVASGFALPRVQSSPGMHPGMVASRLRAQQGVVTITMNEIEEQTPDIEWTPEAVLRCIPEDGGEWYGRNLFTGEPIRFEDSPGNITLRLTDEGWRIAILDGDGAPVDLDK